MKNLLKKEKNINLLYYHQNFNVCFSNKKGVEPGFETAYLLT